MNNSVIEKFFSLCYEVIIKKKTDNLVFSIRQCIYLTTHNVILNEIHQKQLFDLKLIKMK